VRRMAKPQVVICPDCSAIYERQLETLPERHEGSFECTCGYVLSYWGSSNVPKFIKLKDGSK
jgi:hypothetical protein